MLPPFPQLLPLLALLVDPKRKITLASLDMRRFVRPGRVFPASVVWLFPLCLVFALWWWTVVAGSRSIRWSVQVQVQPSVHPILQLRWDVLRNKMRTVVCGEQIPPIVAAFHLSKAIEIEKSERRDRNY